jgi:hypothetical protein
MKLLTILFTLLLSASALAQEDRITILGFWAGMSPEEFENTCLNLSPDYEFKDTTHIQDFFDYQCIHESENSSSYIDYSFTNMYVELLIDCSFMNACGFFKRDFRDELLRRRIVTYCDNLSDSPIACFKSTANINRASANVIFIRGDTVVDSIYIRIRNNSDPNNLRL